MCKMALKDLLKKIRCETALNPNEFFDSVNYGDSKLIELNEKNESNGRFYHRAMYDGIVFVTNTKLEVFDL